jgi:hypothetical protein
VEQINSDVDVIKDVVSEAKLVLVLDILVVIKSEKV